MVEQYRHEKVANAQRAFSLMKSKARHRRAPFDVRVVQATANMRRKEEERAAKLKQDIYVRERQAVHKKYKGKHLAQVRAAPLTFYAPLCSRSTVLFLRQNQIPTFMPT
eukprot:1196712-Rhodomonas_salina.1